MSPETKSPAERAVEEAKSAWRMNIVDPPGRGAKYEPSRRMIQSFIANGLGWRKEGAAYQYDGQFKWCLAFVAWCWRLNLRPDVRRYFMPSTLRLMHLSQGVAWNGRNPPLAREPRFVRPALALPGDVLTVGGKPGTHGTHGVLIVDVHLARREFSVIAGNEWGLLANGEHAEGVVSEVYSFDDARMIVRFAPEDMIGGGA